MRAAVGQQQRRIDPNRLRIVPEVPRAVFLAPVIAMLVAIALVSAALSGVDADDQRRPQPREDSSGPVIDRCCSPALARTL